MLNRAKISRYKLKKLVQLFSLDIQADTVAVLTALNRNTVNRWYMLFRKTIHVHRTLARRRLTGNGELDESYFGPRRVRGRATKRGRGTHKQGSLNNLTQQ